MRRVAVLTLMAWAAGASGVEGAWFRGQLHIHMKGNGDDGTFETVEQVAMVYREAGYHFIAITGHNVRHDAAALSTRDFVTLGGVELHNYAGTWLADNPGWTHANAIACDGTGPVDTTSAKTLQDLIDLAIRLGGLAQVNHPSWQGYGPNAGNGVLTLDRLLATRDATLLEVRNRNDEAMWDAYLSTGRRIFATLTDDNHGTAAGSNMVVVDAPALTRSEIVAALAEGRFYATTSPALVVRAIRRRGCTLGVKSNGTKVEFIGQNGVCLRTVEAGSARCTLPPGGLYVRARVSDADGNRALTQPYFPESREMP